MSHHDSLRKERHGPASQPLGALWQRPSRLVLLWAALLLGCYSPPPQPPPPNPEVERDRDCAQRFIAPRLPTLEDVAFLYPMMLNPRDAQGRNIYATAQQGQCYVETGLIPPGVPLANAAMPPPGVQLPRTPVPCPPVMLDARWRACPEGRVVTNAARCPCVCHTSPAFAPPTILPTPCPPAG